MTGHNKADSLPAGRLELQSVGLSLQGRCLFERIDLRVSPGEIATVMGPSGCGKSSLLAFICGTLERSFVAKGEIVLNGRRLTVLPPQQRQVGILFQDDLLFPHLSVAENLAFGLPPSLSDQPARQERIVTALRDADLEGFGDRDPATLSGGQRARVALMRTLLAEPRALLLDEPFAKLDLALRWRFRNFVFEHARAQGLPTLLVTHDPADAANTGGPIIEIGTRESGGRLASSDSRRRAFPGSGAKPKPHPAAS